MGAMTSEAARWIMAPRSFRRLVPTFGWLGPLAMGRPAHSFVAQVRAILAADDDARRSVVQGARADAGRRRQPRHPHPRADSEEIADRIPGAELVVISGAAHGFMIEHASTFNRILRDFLHRVSQEPTASAATG